MTQHFPWQQIQQAAMGALLWPPAIFWAATPPELWLALQGWQKAHGMHTDTPAEDLHALKAMLQAAEAKQQEVTHEF